MSIEVKCDVDGCRKVLEQPGALLFSPPMGGLTVVKIHVCQSCYDKLLRAFFYHGSREGGSSNGG